MGGSCVGDRWCFCPGVGGAGAGRGGGGGEVLVEVEVPVLMLVLEEAAEEVEEVPVVVPMHHKARHTH